MEIQDVGDKFFHVDGQKGRREETWSWFS